MPNRETWVKQSALSEPAAHVGAIGELSSNIRDLAGTVQGLLVHEGWLGAYGLNEQDYRGVSRATLPIAERLSRIVARDARPLRIARPPGGREIGTCRDFALMLCSFLRGKRVPARVRCGFASYFGGTWEDHWVCEYWDRPARRWRLCDPQLDRVLSERCRIVFDPADVPDHAFMTAGRAWLACRRNAADPAAFGHGTTAGAWFIAVNVVRDHYVVNHRETSAWDEWRSAPEAKRAVGEQETAMLDELAARPEQPLVTIVPYWLEN